MLSRVLVTGAGGFVGSHLVERLVARGTQVLALSRTPREEGLDDRIRWVQGDVTEPETYREALRGVDGVVHLAALLTARRVSEYEHANVLGTARLLETCAEECPELRRAVVVSTVAAMGPSRNGRSLTESDPCRPANAYGASKLAAEAEALALAPRIPITILRPVFVYGPGDARGAAQLESWLRSPPGTWRSPIRALSLVHVDDFAAACESALTADLPSGSTFLVAAPAACDWADVRTAVAGALNSLAADGAIHRELAPRLVDRIEALDPATGSGPPPEWWGCDVNRVVRSLGFSGRSLAEGALDTIASYAAAGFFSPDRWPAESALDLEIALKPAGQGIRQETT
jgi:nucleoside-diphosphate-sugar epimerase